MFYTDGSAVFFCCCIAYIKYHLANLVNAPNRPFCCPVTGPENRCGRECISAWIKALVIHAQRIEMKLNEMLKNASHNKSNWARIADEESNGRRRQTQKKQRTRRTIAQENNNGCVWCIRQQTNEQTTIQETKKKKHTHTYTRAIKCNQMAFFAAPHSFVGCNIVSAFVLLLCMP